jgi:hypothetical protein
MLNCMKNLLKKIGVFLKRTTGKAFALLRDNAALAVEVTARLKAIVESDAAGTVVELIPGKADDVALAALRKVLPIISKKLAVIFGALKENDKNADAVEAIINRLKELEPSLRGSFYLAFSAELSAALSDGKLSLAEAAALAQMVYAEMKAAKA